MATGRFKRVLGAALFAAAVLSDAGGSEPAGSAPSLGGTRSTVGKWIATQELIFKERKDWQEGRELLRARIEAAEREIARIEAKLEESRTGLSELHAKQAEVAHTKQRLEESSSRLAEAAAGIEAEIRRLHVSLPVHLQEKIAPLYRRIPEDPATTTISAAERFQNVLGILNEVHKANSEISLIPEIRALSDGKPSEVKTVYLGLGQAYFLSSRGEAGIGRPTPEGWRWEAANDQAPGITEAIEILENKGKPRFVPLPVTIQ